MKYHSLVQAKKVLDYRENKSKQNSQFSASIFIPSVNFWLDFSDVQRFQCFQKGNASCSPVKYLHIPKFCQTLRARFKMLPHRLLPSCFVLTKSGTVVSVSLTNIAGTTTWTCNLIYHPICALIWYFHLERADKSFSS